jgi:hypothetical protein
MGGDLEVEVPGTGEVEEHPGERLAARAAMLVAVRTQPPVGERAPELLVDPAEASDDLGLAVHAPPDARLVGDDEAGAIVWPLAGETLGDVRHQYRAAVGADHRAVVARLHEGSAPVQE